MSRPELWLYLLAAVTVLLIALRRVLHRQAPLSDELFSKQVAIDHVYIAASHGCDSDGTVGSINPALAKTIGALPKEILGQHWEKLFPENERAHVREAYSRALLGGKISISTVAQRTDGSQARVDVLLVTIHDSKTRLVGHYCLMDDRTRELELEAHVEKLVTALESGATASK